MIGAGFVDDDEYREWKTGGVADLQSILIGDLDEIEQALAQAHAYLLKQKLASETRPVSITHSIGESKASIKLCTTYIVPVDYAPMGAEGDAYRATIRVIQRDEMSVRAQLQEVQPALLRQFLSRRRVAD